MHRTLLALLLLPFALGGSPSPRPAADGLPLGLGVAVPPLTPERPLYFYGLSFSDLDQQTDAMTPTDSLSFRQGPHHVEVATGPPWLLPEVLTPDYVLFRAVTVSPHWVRVVVNRSEELPRMVPRTMWVARDAVAFEPWEAFLLNVYAVEPLDVEANPIRIDPSETKDILSTAWQPVRPLAVQDDWLLVSTDGLADRIAPTGWLRWRVPDSSVAGGYRLLIEYVLHAQ